MKHTIAIILIGLIILGSTNFAFTETNVTMSGTPTGYALQGIEQLANYEHLRQEAFSSYQSAIS